MADVTTCIVAPGISGCFVGDQSGYPLHSLEEAAFFEPKPIPIPADLQGRTWKTWEEALQCVREFFEEK